MRTRVYETVMVAILGAAVGVMCFEQASVYYLMPFIKPALNLNNTQIGLIVGAYCVIFAISSYATSALADSVGRRKILLVAITAALSLGSILSGLANSFIALLGARVVMGLLEGPMFPLTQSIIALESPAQRRGINMGIVGSLGANAFGYFVAPLVLIRIGEFYHWRTGFFVIVLPGLLCALLVLLFIREPESTGSITAAVQDVREEDSRTGEAFGSRNVWLCAIICCFYVAYNTLGFTFLPLYYVNVRHIASSQMSFLMGTVGISAMLSSILLPLLSDHLGRKTVLVAACLLSILCPLAALFYGGPLIVLALLPFVGWLMAGAGSLFMGTIPSESVSARSISTAMGFIVGLGVLGGGLAGPTMAGWCADRWGLGAPLMFQMGCALAGALVAMGLRETRPREVGATTVQTPLTPS